MVCDILIPFYGNVKYLKECLKSIRRQVLNGLCLNVIVVNDNPSLTLHKIKNTDNISFSVINNSVNLGLVANWNKCLRLSSSEYCHILHYDDLLVKDFYDKMINNIMRTNSNIGIAICKAKKKFTKKFSTRYWGSVFRREKQSSQTRFFAKGDEAIREILNASFVCSGVILTKKAITSSGFFDDSLSFSSDEEYWARVSKYNDLAIIEDQLVQYRFHKDNYALRTWKLKGFADQFIQTRIKRLNLLSRISVVDRQIEFEKIALMFTQITYKLWLKNEIKWAEYYISKAKEVYPGIEMNFFYQDIIKLINKRFITKVFEKFKSAH